MAASFERRKPRALLHQCAGFACVRQAVGVQTASQHRRPHAHSRAGWALHLPAAAAGWFLKADYVRCLSIAKRSQSLTGGALPSLQQRYQPGPMRAAPGCRPISCRWLCRQTCSAVYVGKVQDDLWCSRTIIPSNAGGRALCLYVGTGAVSRLPATSVTAARQGPGVVVCRCIVRSELNRMGNDRGSPSGQLRGPMGG